MELHGYIDHIHRVCIHSHYIGSKNNRWQGTIIKRKVILIDEQSAHSVRFHDFIKNASQRDHQHPVYLAVWYFALFLQSARPHVHGVPASGLESRVKVGERSEARGGWLTSSEGGGLWSGSRFKLEWQSTSAQLCPGPSSNAIRLQAQGANTGHVCACVCVSVYTDDMLPHTHTQTSVGKKSTQTWQTVKANRNRLKNICIQIWSFNISAYTSVWVPTWKLNHKLVVARQDTK